MTCNILVLFTNDSESLAKNLINLFENVSINAICVDNNTNHLPNIRPGTKTKIHVVFFSPSFLKFLEDNPVDAYNICGKMEAVSTLAVFCRGLTEKDVLCYHMAPLKCFSSWSKFRVMENGDRRGVFPEEMIRKIREVVERDDPVEITIVPQFLSRKSNVVYLIFSKQISDSVSIHINDSGEEMKINPEKMNPYVIKFYVPDSVFHFSHNISISVLEKEKTLMKQMIHVSQNNVDSTPLPTRGHAQRRVTREEVHFDEQLRYLKTFSGMPYDDDMFQTITESAVRRNTRIGGSQESVFQFKRNSSMSALEKDTTLLKQVMQVLPNNREIPLPSKRRIQRHLTKEEIHLGEQLRFMKTFSGMPYDDETFQTITEFSGYTNVIQGSSQVANNEKAESDLKELCRNYGIEDLSVLISDKFPVAADATMKSSSYEIHKQIDPNISLRRGSFSRLPEMDASNRMDSYLEADVLRLRCTSRSLSLPPTLLPNSFLRNSDGHYLDMGGRPSSIDMKPHEKLLFGLRHSYMEKALPWKDDDDLDSLVTGKLSTEGYVSVTLDEKEPANVRALLKKGLSQSQQELLDLMQNFKEGDSTISNVERQFQMWTERHCNGEAAKQGRVRKTSAFALPWKKPKKTKDNQTKDCQNAIKHKQDEQISPRKISNTSASSGSSKTSELSTRTISPRIKESNGKEIGNCDPPPTKWVSSYISGRGFCPLYPESNPPPLPARPPPKTATAIPTPLPRRKAPAILEETPLEHLKQECHMKEGNLNGEKIMGLQKFVVEELSERFSAEKCPLKEDMPPAGTKVVKSIESTESSSKPALRVFEEKPQIVIFRRSASLPSNLHQSGEFSGNLPFTASENSPLNAESNTRDSCTCENCIDMEDSLSKQRGNKNNNRLLDSPPPETNLSRCQVELLDLLYAFKRGDKSISQVEDQFREWHSRHAGESADDFLFGSSSVEKCKHEKNKKVWLPGLKNLILRKPKKKSDARYPEFEFDMKRTKKLSESSSTSQKRLSKVSNASNSSGTSEHNDVFKMGFFSSVGPPFPKRPPPMPPNKPLPPLLLDEPLPLKQPSVENHEPPPLDKTDAKPRPIPPPKPKSLFKQEAVVENESVFDLPMASDVNDKAGEPKKDDEEKDIRSSSPIYIEPNIHPPRIPRRKISDPQPPKKTTEKCKKDEKRTPKISRVLQLPSKDKTSHKPFNPPMSPTCKSPKLSVSSNAAPELPPQTLALLKMANLLSFPDEGVSKFYVRRSKSFPNLRVSQMQNPPIYIELIGQTDVSLRRSSLFSGSGR